MLFIGDKQDLIIRLSNFFYGEIIKYLGLKVYGPLYNYPITFKP